MYKIKYTPDFDLDFDSIKEEVREVSCSDTIADKYMLDFILKIKKKQQFPESGIPLYFEDFFTGYYYVHFKAYNAFYVIKDEYIEMVRALPSKSDYMRVLFGEHYQEDLQASNEPDYLNETEE